MLRGKILSLASLHISMNLNKWLCEVESIETFISSYNSIKKISREITVKNTLRKPYAEKHFLNWKETHNIYVYIYG